MGNRSTYRARSRSRAGALIAAHLDWLDGYPVDDGDVRVARWQTVPRDGREPKLVELDGGVRSRALRTARTIFRDERDVLARMVPDPERWLRAIELAARRDEPSELYTHRERGFLETVPRAFAWLCAAHGDLSLACAWAEHRETFDEVASRIDPPFALQLCRLSTRVRTKVIAPLLRTFRDELTHEVSTKRPPKGWERTPPTPIPRGPSELVQPLTHLVREALKGDAKRAAAICGLWAAMEPGFILRQWNAFWVGLEATRASVDEELRFAFEQRRTCRIAGELKRTMGGAPPELFMDVIIDDILRMSHRPVIASAAARALSEAVAPRTPPIPSRASPETRRAHRPSRSRTRWNRCANALGRWSRADWPQDIALTVFRAVEADPFDIDLIAALERIRNPNKLRVLLGARRRIEEPSLARLEDLADSGATIEEAVQLHDVVGQVPFPGVGAAFRLTRDIDTLRAILPRIAERPTSDLDALFKLPNVHERFRREHLKPWIVLARRAVGLDHRTLLGLRPTPIEAEHAWIARYPEELRQALHRLAETDPDAEARGAKLLSPDIRDPDAIRRELMRLPASAHERRATLLDRLRNPSGPSTARLRRLARRVELAADRTFVERWIEAVEAHLREHASIDVEPEMLAALRTLKRPMRRLAERVVSEGDLRDAPANAAYLKRMRELGVNMTPWLDGIGVHHHAGRALALESDPLEVLKMGGYFSTCLSPGAFNFFAAVVDAADVNKRVLYARDSKGVAARVLLALDARGELVRYETFLRNRDDDTIDRAIAAFIDELLKRMGTRYAPNPEAPIELLMTNRWYCDCPLPAPAGDDLSELLAAASADEVVARLEREVGLSPATLAATIARLPQEPSKAEPILRVALQRRDELPDETIRAAAALAEQHQLRPLAEELISERAPRLLWTRHGTLDHFVAKVMLARNPRELLRALRARRRRGGWERESRHEVLLYAGRALVALDRTRKARRLLELADARGSKAAQRALSEL